MSGLRGCGSRQMQGKCKFSHAAPASARQLSPLRQHLSRGLGGAFARAVASPLRRRSATRRVR
eukprot:9679683-Lingulodinium_polyedra.AAC.1